MAEKITPRSKDFPQWFQDIVLQAKLADYSPVKGCMVIRPNGYSIWERIQQDLDRRIKALGVRNAYFPIFIPESFIKKEAQHVEGFAPQCAVVTYAGAKDLQEKLVVRPTSETIINAMFAKWIQSYRDLPLKINQWANVVRWEMRTRLFLRTTEFLWQEGHTCHATPEEAEALARKMLGVYASFAEEVLAMPVLPGLKTDSERFAGALRTYTIEAMMQDKKALQSGTSHNLGENFSKAFDTKYLDRNGKQQFVHQTSWGVSTRLIGGMVMTHSDDRGLILPPRVAETHVVIIPIMGKTQAVKETVLEAAREMAEAISELTVEPLGQIRAVVDDDESKQPGWKFHEHEMLGTPIRIEIGPKDLEKKHVVMVRRDQGEKNFVKFPDITKQVRMQLPAMQKEMLEKARTFRDSNTHVVSSYAEFKDVLDSKGGFLTSPWCGSTQCEEKVKNETKATIRALPLGSDYEPIAEAGPCLCGQQSDKNVRAVFARSY